MNLRAVANGLTSAINPNTMGTIQISTGSTAGVAGRRIPTYRTFPARMQVQALTERDILHLDALNVAGSSHKVYVNGRLDALVRPQNKGGDLLTFGGQTWLTTAVLEDFPDWCVVSVTLQNGS